MVPILETERLRLRCFREEDLAAQASMLGDEAIMQFLGGVRQSREETWRRMLAMIGCWPTFGFGYWAIERLSDGAVLGQVGFADYKRDINPSIDTLPEMGWVVARHAHGHGYAGEAVEAGLRWADAHLAGRDIVAIIDPGNEASLALAKRSGFSQYEEAMYKGAPILIFRRFARSPAAAATTATPAP
ncbi:GNAT family N-acetyltransferase [Sphingosinicella rhizophila]|uniref:GNAT family N-acetyltransferase n=1 Tax=Sphingosinicella rhizophila TaxID=3050082 RepID=A0ABU3Q2N0_9SPHN|nr:GNAT family N-acetyltransferase [Sphingosinicella sp. GR2756]MDT9597676.1 GNAT family N-acetyltransferase [Sphingosinicella sp. GR2756]